eukprot:2373084-Alexandrium_andersonii.AAC.1
MSEDSKSKCCAKPPAESPAPSCAKSGAKMPRESRAKYGRRPSWQAPRRPASRAVAWSPAIPVRSHR